MFSAYARNVLANLPKAYSNDRRSHCVRAKKFIAYARSQPEAGHEEGMPVRRLWPEKSPARAWLHLRQLQHARRRGKGAVMSLIGTYWRRCLSEGLLCARTGPSPKLTQDGHGRLTG